MKVLKKGTIIDCYIGKCSNCNAVLEAVLKDLVVEKIDDDTPATINLAVCDFCNVTKVMFYKVDTKEAKAIIRKNKIEVDVGDIQIKK